jgi:hypothetical protein
VFVHKFITSAVQTCTEGVGCVQANTIVAVTKVNASRPCNKYQGMLARLNFHEQVVSAFLLFNDLLLNEKLFFYSGS